jgi:hypothetical protein
VRTFKDLAVPISTNALISSTSIDETVLVGQKPQHYYSGKGCAIGYEPAAPPTFVSWVDAPNYRGEVYFLNQKGTAKLLTYTPGRIRAEFKANAPGLLVFNTNRLFGWTITEGEGEIIDDPSQLLLVQTRSNAGRITLRYTPFTFKPLVAAFAVGLILFFSIALSQLGLKRRKK